MAEVATSISRSTTRIIDVNTIAAVPKYLERTDRPNDELSLGLRFGMYLNVYNEQNWFVDKESRPRFEHRQDKLLEALDSRQKTMLQGVSKDNSLTLVAKSTSPFVTGMGNEHPLENGFSFLNPYGLPYLPGSSIKGVLRRSAEELIHADWYSGESDWSLMDIIYLFGLETLHTDQKWYGGFRVDIVEIKKYLHFIAQNHSDLEKRISTSNAPILELVRSSNLSAKGILNFWDCYPSGYRGLEFDIMTPHQTDYYQKGRVPHDSESPNPIRFLTIPPNSQFIFHVCVSDANQIRDYIPKNWKVIIEKSFEHAFQWLGFGAKTAVGYGTMERIPKAEIKIQDEISEIKRKEKEKQDEAEKIESMSPVEQLVHTFLRDRQNQNDPETSSLITALRQGTWEGNLKMDIARIVKDRLQKENKWKENSQAKNPKKDKVYQNTLQVMEWIKEE